ncbi:MAG: MamI family restriction endonuclease [Terracidiphilus sp.]|jgi:hypothetical protein
MNQKTSEQLQKALGFLNLQYQSFSLAAPFATATGHPVPCDSRGWSQILVSVLTGLKGLARKKGPDFSDGSDVKAANAWEAIDVPRFNGVVKAGTKAATAGKLQSLDKVPYLFLVLWDHAPVTNRPRCRIWCVRPQSDKAFRTMCKKWYDQVANGEIKSNNFQLHPPIGKDSNVSTNKCGNLSYPLLMCAEYIDDGFVSVQYEPEVMKSGECSVSA